MPEPVFPEFLKTLNGLELLEGLRDGRFPPPSMAVTLGFRLTQVESGCCVFEGMPGPQHCNPLGFVHGGFASTLLDSAMGCAVHSLLDAGQGFSTLEFKINFIRPISAETGSISAEGKIIHFGRQTATADGRITDASGRLLAHASTTCIIFPLP